MVPSYRLVLCRTILPAYLNGSMPRHCASSHSTRAFPSGYCTCAHQPNRLGIGHECRHEAQQLLDAVRLFGETMEQHLSAVLMDEHPEIAVLDSRSMPPDRDGKVIPFGGRVWHTDHTNHHRPPKITALYALALPSAGGDTSFANMRTAYAQLPAARRAVLDTLRTVNTIEDFDYISAEAREKFGQPRTPSAGAPPSTQARLTA